MLVALGKAGERRPNEVVRKRSVKSFYLRGTSTRLGASAGGVSAKSAARESELFRKIATTAIDWSFTLRPISIEHIERLGGASRLPPIAVWEFQPGRYRGIDGYHRWRLARHRGEGVVEATVHRYPPGPAGQRAFEFEAVRRNLEHGLPLSREERNRAIGRLWNRWGRSDDRPDGRTLEEIGQLFNLTKQRVHQILTAQSLLTGQAASDQETGRAAPAFSSREAAHLRATSERAVVGRSAVSARHRPPGRFSTFGRFSAATRRLRNLLRDGQFITALLRQHRPEAIQQLDEIRYLIDETLAGST
jgi:hypothetical protein